jgi:hypothetical protein
VLQFQETKILKKCKTAVMGLNMLRIENGKLIP